MVWPFRSRRTRAVDPASDFADDLDTPLVRLGPKTVITLGDAFEGVLGLGVTGGGKTSALGQTYARAMLSIGAGGLVCCAKSDEADLWLSYAKKVGCLRRIVRIGADPNWCFNLLDYYLARYGLDAAGNLVNLIEAMAEAVRAASNRPSSNAGDQFWDQAVRQLLLNLLVVLYAATGRLSLEDLYRAIISAPQTAEQSSNPNWSQNSFLFSVFEKARTNPVHPIDPHTLWACANYWMYDFSQLAGKTRSSIVITLTSLLSRFAHGRLHRLFCTDTTFVPEMSYTGGIVLLLDMPVKTWHEDGIIAQRLLKYIWQKAVEARPQEERMRPTFLYADECQFFLSHGYEDAEFQSTARSSRVATLYMTQNLPTIYSRMIGPRPEHAADALIGNLRTRVFFANGDQTTNRWAAECIGQGLVMRESGNIGRNEGGNSGQSRGSGIGDQSGSSSGGSSSPQGGSSQYGSNRGESTNWSYNDQRGWSWGESESIGWSEQKDYRIDPSVFARELRSGGRRHNGEVDAILARAGTIFPETGDIYQRITFRQEWAE